MRWDFEKAIVETVVLYLQATIDSDVLAAAPVASFYDAMAIDDGARIVVIAEDGETKVSGPGEAIVNVEVGVKTPADQPTLAADVSTHFDRVNCVRDLFATSDPAGDIAAYNVDGISVDHVETVRRFGTDLNRESAFLYSTLELSIHCHTTT